MKKRSLTTSDAAHNKLDAALRKEIDLVSHLLVGKAMKCDVLSVFI